MAVDRINITSPVGRFVAGSLYKPNDKNFDGKPLVTQSGPNAGQPRVNYFIGLAIPKSGEQHWSQTKWGSQIWALGHQAHPQAAQRPDFAWKIEEDGNSKIFNKRNRRPCDQEGWAGNWILKFSGGFAPKIYFQDGANWIQNLQPDAVKPGYFVQVAFSVDDNRQQNNPGVYLNHQAIAFRGYGPEISFGPNVDEMGFGEAPLPAGASAIPLAATLPAGGAPPPPSGVYPPPPAPGAYAAPYAAPPAPAPIPVAPNPGFVQMPPPPNAVSTRSELAAYSPNAGAVPPPPVPASLSSTRRMTAKAGNVTYEAYRAANWTDGQLIAEGLMTV